MPRALATTSNQRSLAFARRYFACCPAHLEEADAACVVIETLSGEQPNLDPDTSIGEILDGGTAAVLSNSDSLDLVELAMTIEEEFGLDAEEAPARDLSSWALFRHLLGPRASRSTWSPGTLPSRSLRGVIEERVRLRGDCSRREQP